MKLKNLIYPLIVLLLASGCKKEAKIEPDKFDPEYHLPQGNHPYDTKIMNFYRDYGSYILYKFNEKDFRWNVTNNISFVADQGDENYIASALDALDTYLFKYYSKDFLQKALPYKILLASRIRALDQDNNPVETPVNAASTSSQLTFGRAGSSLAGLTAEELKGMKKDLHREFWNQAVGFGKIPLPPVFVVATKYEDVASWNSKNYGVFLDPVTYSATVYSDFIAYINMIVSNTPEELEQSQFLPQNDPNGKFKFKYNAIVKYYKETYGVDLQSIDK